MFEKKKEIALEKDLFQTAVPFGFLPPVNLVSNGVLGYGTVVSPSADILQPNSHEWNHLALRTLRQFAQQQQLEI